ncbi:LPXTG cell wall anchor domain-containing protein [Actinoplanes sp. NEAU-A12]|uniref:LPXTG cell wall anchor domain-containing protein n=1 Tax=Actinoplanes sandaracinus TaxID=3045177 RepID=A0ABT6WU75_9ACTN|nr:LPXTG cell wall anchor domain-containing protein [Actinoplanes sandaracinus]MDI6103249.1 LPXTG cell wall anchor domain-containing protein [Actinoplanes sandaracinus]
MSFTRRLPTVGATVLAALALGGAPAMATDAALKPAHASTVPSPDTGDQRGNPGYGGTVKEAPQAPGGPAATTPAPTGSLKAATPTTTGPTRGRPGYTPGIISSPGPSETATPPTGTVKEIPPVGVASEAVTPTATRTAGGAGVSSGGTLPLTGAPLGGTLALGGLMLAGGAAAVWYTRRRRNA